MATLSLYSGEEDHLMADGIAFIDGEYVPSDKAKISVFDLGFSRSDVAYDVVSTWKGLFFRLDDHVDRFLLSCAGTRLSCEYDKDEIKRILAECTYRARLQDAYVEMLVTRGQFLSPGSRDIRHTKPTFLAYAIPYVWIATPEKQQIGLHVFIAKTPRIPDASVVARYKNFHWGDLTRAQFEALDAGADVAVLCGVTGDLAEGPGFNVFFIKGERLFTPRTNVLEGITRRTVLALAEEIGIPVEAGNYPADALRTADEAFICSTAGGIIPVTTVDDKALGTGKPGPISWRLRELYWEKREAGWLGTPITSLLMR
jgi:branched-chain amino acid aminotransferase